MKRVLKNIAAMALLCVAAVGCDAFHKVSSESSTTGNPYEVIVVCAQPDWQSELGDTLQAVLKQPVSELTTYEPMFDVLRILPNNFGSLVERHRNIITVQVDGAVAEPSITVRYDVTAKPQIFVSIKGPDDKTLAEYVSANRDNIVRVLEKAERDRSVDYGKRYYSQQTEALLREKFGMQMFVPDNFTVRTQSDDMVWISQEFPASSQGFFIYKYPYGGKGSLSVESLIAARDKFAARIPGPADGSYMSTVKQIADASGENYIDFEPQMRMLEIGGRTWIEMAGLWDVENYVMGGPFVSYTTVNQATGEVVTLDCYVYAPKGEKRNMVRELQHFVYLMNFDGAVAADGQTAAQ
ncbi:MAG: DUF4837 family protein [Alistipes sp.]|nr:DUF4837 family protein [Alistipes sp.]